MSKLRLEEIKFLVEGYVHYDRNEVSTIPKRILILLLCLIYKEAMLSETVGLEP